jgi:hypothetical protein
MSARGAPRTSERNGFDGVRVFSATMHEPRAHLGERVTSWLAANPHHDIVDIVVTQSSDAEFHCVAITVFYKEPAAR